MNLHLNYTIMWKIQNMVNFGNVTTHFKKNNFHMGKVFLVVSMIQQAVLTNGREC